MELDHVVLADVVSPRPDGKIDLHGVGWDTIYAATVPATHPRMDVAIRFLLSAQEVETAHRVVVTLISTDGAELARIQTDVEPMPPDQRAQVAAGRRIGIGMLLTLATVTFPDYGAYCARDHLGRHRSARADQTLRLAAAPGGRPAVDATGTHTIEILAARSVPDG